MQFAGQNGTTGCMLQSSVMSAVFCGIVALSHITRPCHDNQHSLSFIAADVMMLLPGIVLKVGNIAAYIVQVS